MNNLEGQTAVVTGSSSGIGRAIALQLAQAGAHVLIHARAQRTAAESVAGQVRGLGRMSEVFLADLADPKQRVELVERAWHWRQGVQVWVNNAGADVLTGPAASWTFEEKLARLWSVDVVGTIQLSKMVGQRMREQGDGVLLNMGWDQAEQGMAGDSGEMFGAVKGAIMAFSRSLAQSLAPHVRVNCLAPGWIQTAWGETASDAWQQRARRESLRNRWGTPEDVARVACFLASSDAAFLNGQVVAINGGFRYGAPLA
ncbi:MAG: SDR family NAD(P)-dependent oxidoreductase [Pirellulaceae bacterium]